MWKNISPRTAHKAHGPGANKFQPDMLARFIEANGFTQFRLVGQPDWKRLFETGRHYPLSPRRVDYLENHPLWIEHARVFKNLDTGLVCLAAQPYASNLLEVIEKVISWAHHRGLDVMIYEPEYSWYYPGGTFLVIVHLPGAEVKLCKTKGGDDCDCSIARRRSV